MDTPTPFEPDPSLPDWSHWPSTRVVSHRLAARGFVVKRGIFRFGGIDMPAPPGENESTLDQFILHAKNRGASACSATLEDARSARIEVLLAEDGCRLRSDSVDVRSLIGEG